MKKLLCIGLLICLGMMLTACAQNPWNAGKQDASLNVQNATYESTVQERAFPAEADTYVSEDEPIGGESTMQEKTLALRINGETVNVRWEDNDAVNELIRYAQNGGIIVHTNLYGGFEQVGTLPQIFTRNDVQMTTQPGDIVLYSGDQLVLFFGQNSWSYTKLGHIEELSESELSKLLGGNSAQIELGLNAYSCEKLSSRPSGKPLLTFAVCNVTGLS